MSCPSDAPGFVKLLKIISYAVLGCGGFLFVLTVAAIVVLLALPSNDSHDAIANEAILDIGSIVLVLLCALTVVVFGSLQFAAYSIQRGDKQGFSVLSQDDEGAIDIFAEDDDDD